MKIRTAAMLIAIAPVLGLTACSGTDTGDPADVTKSALEALHDDDTEALCKLATNKAETGPIEDEEMDECIAYFDLLLASSDENPADYDPSAEISVDAEQDQAKTTVPAWDDLTFDLMRIDEEWLISDVT